MDEEDIKIEIRQETRNREKNVPTPTKFQGNNPERWVDSYDVLTSSLNWSESTKISAFPNYLGESEFWFDTLSSDETRTWSKLRESFLNRFLISSREKESLRRKFKTRRQRPSESVMDYTDDLKSIGRKLCKSDDEIAEAIVDGLEANLRQAVRRQNSRSLRDVITAAVEEEADLVESGRVSNIDSVKEELKSHIEHVVGNMVQDLSHEVNRISSQRQQTTQQTNPRHRQQHQYQTWQQQTTLPPLDAPTPPFLPPSTPTQYQHPQQHLNMCICCGDYYPPFEFRRHRAQCRAQNYTCTRCHKPGHYESLCFSTPAQFPPNSEQ